MNVISGIHHITAIAGDPEQNIDFCTSVLGLRLIKVTVSFDDLLPCAASASVRCLSIWRMWREINRVGWRNTKLVI